MCGPRGRRRHMCLRAEQNDRLVRIPQVISDHLGIFENRLRAGAPSCYRTRWLRHNLRLGPGGDVGSDLLFGKLHHLLAPILLVALHPFKFERVRRRTACIRDRRNQLHVSFSHRRCQLSPPMRPGSLPACCSQAHLHPQTTQRSFPAQARPVRFPRTAVGGRDVRLTGLRIFRLWIPLHRRGRAGG